MNKFIQGPIHKSKGVNKTEIALEKVCDYSFLGLWSYANPWFMDKFNNKKEELCDLIVPFGSNILLFSSKNIGWSDKSSTEVAWKRWYKRAVWKSTGQLERAKRLTKNFPDRIFLDEKCSENLPINIAEEINPKFHMITVTEGTRGPCKKYFNGREGALIINSNLSGQQHTDYKNAQENGISPSFMIGDVNPGGSFVHVFDHESFEKIMLWIDTVEEFIEYLNFREKRIRSQTKIIAYSEEDFLGDYILQNQPMWEDYKKLIRNINMTIIEDNTYEAFKFSKKYTEILERKMNSQKLDSVIRNFTNAIIDGKIPKEIIEIQNKYIDIKEGPTEELALRVLAAERRMGRERLSDAMRENEKKAKLFSSGMSVAALRSGAEKYHKNTLIILLTTTDKAFQGFENRKEDFRVSRLEILWAHAGSYLYDNKEFSQVVGLSFGVGSQNYEEILILKREDLNEAALLKSRKIFQIGSRKRKVPKFPIRQKPLKKFFGVPKRIKK